MVHNSPYSGRSLDFSGDPTSPKYRPSHNEYLEGNILIQPVHTQVVKLYRNGDLDTPIPGVHIGKIDNFWGVGVYAFYGIDG